MEKKDLGSEVGRRSRSGPRLESDSWVMTEFFGRSLATRVIEIVGRDLSLYLRNRSRRARLRSTAGRVRKQLHKRSARACRIGENTVTRDGPRGLFRIISYVDKSGSLRQILSARPRIVTEDRSPDNHHKVVALKLLADRGGGAKKLALKKPMGLWESRSSFKRRRDHGRVQLFGKRDTLVPTPCLIECPSDD
jgi:hypothetical protein